MLWVVRQRVWPEPVWVAVSTREDALSSGAGLLLPGWPSCLSSAGPCASPLSSEGLRSSTSSIWAYDLPTSLLVALHGSPRGQTGTPASRLWPFSLQVVSVGKLSDLGLSSILPQHFSFPGDNFQSHKVGVSNSFSPGATSASWLPSKGRVLMLGLCKCNSSFTRGKGLGAAAG